MTKTLTDSAPRNKARAQQTFRDLFGYEPESVFRAPGRVNLIGEHTDYNEGFVLPCAIEYETVVAVARRHDQEIRAVACDHNEQLTHFSLGPVIPHSTQAPWSNYLRGVVSVFQAEFSGLQGFDITIAGDVPRGAGLSSSASYEVAVATALNSLFEGGFSPTVLAQISQRAENDFVGCRCGIMDQLISARGQRNCASLIDCRSLDMRAVSIPSDWRILIVDSKVQRGLVDSEYNDRRTQCEMAAAQLGVGTLRDVSLDDFNKAASDLDELIRRRARHVVTENARTLEAADALNRGDMRTMARLMRASHASMRNDFEITVPPIDFLVSLIDDHLGDTGGVRMTGGGFGGCVVALIPATKSDEIQDMVSSAYAQKMGFEAEVHLCTAVEGAGVLGGRGHG